MKVLDTIENLKSESIKEIEILKRTVDEIEKLNNLTEILKRNVTRRLDQVKD